MPQAGPKRAAASTEDATPYMASSEAILNMWSSEETGPLHVVQDSTLGCRCSVPILPGLEHLLDHKCMRRLQDVYQLGTVSVLCPTAVHSRFQHSVGVSGLALDVVSFLHQTSTRFLAETDIRPIHLLALQCGALIHDLGHIPLSHSAEEYLYHAWKARYPELRHILCHEALSDTLFRVVLESEVLKTPGPGAQFWDEAHNLAGMCQAIAWGGKYRSLATSLGGGAAGGALLSKELEFLTTIVANPTHGADVDRMDYLLRDAVMCGHKAPVNFFLPTFSTAKLVNNSIHFHTDTADILRDMYIRRWDMNLKYYRHAVSQAASLQLMDALIAANDTLRITDAFSDLLGTAPDASRFNDIMTEQRLWAGIREADPEHASRDMRYAQRLLQRFDARDLYREAHFEMLDDYDALHNHMMNSSGGMNVNMSISMGAMNNVGTSASGGLAGSSDLNASSSGVTFACAAGNGAGSSASSGSGYAGSDGLVRTPTPPEIATCQDHNLGVSFRAEDLRVQVFDIRAGRMVNGELKSSLELVPFYDTTGPNGEPAPSSYRPEALLLRPPLMKRYLRIFWAGDAQSQEQHATMCRAVSAAYHSWRRREGGGSTMGSTPKRQRLATIGELGCFYPGNGAAQHVAYGLDSQARFRS